MSRLALFFLSCVMALSIFTRTAAGAPKVDTVPHPDVQCQAADQKAACFQHLHNGDLVDCMNLKCVAKNARRRNSDRMIRGVGIGIAFDGTHCNVNKVCRKGVCTELTKNERMPMQEGANREAYNCYFKR